MFSKITLAAGLALTLLAGTASAETIKVGVTPGPHAQIMEKVKELAAKDGLEIEILEFSDYVVPNQALNDGELQANSFQHKPYLDNQVADRGFDIVDVAYNVNFPMAVYSKKHASFDALPDGATIAIPNDPTNGGRALFILADQGVIKLN
ncbi:MAG TPA: MetQ/NlpA family ABC transporter substrate-binding protein, partial [Mycoplana sp.]|nr:MetQ/NlpA family ABC transporter substrate-binding protein [Mycoplana sp.]